MSALLNNDMFLYALIVLILSLCATGFGLLGFMTGKNADSALRPYVNFALVMCCFIIPASLFVFVDGFTMAVIASAWMIGVFVGRYAGRSVKPE